MPTRPARQPGNARCCWLRRLSTREVATAPDRRSGPGRSAQLSSSSPASASSRRGRLRRGRLLPSAFSSRRSSRSSLRFISRRSSSVARLKWCATSLRFCSMASRARIDVWKTWANARWKRSSAMICWAVSLWATSMAFSMARAFSLSRSIVSAPGRPRALAGEREVRRCLCACRHRWYVRVFPPATSAPWPAAGIRFVASA